jgi:hypothetical protein
MFCGACGSSNPDDFKFCGRCGSAIVASISEAPDKSQERELPIRMSAGKVIGVVLVCGLGVLIAFLMVGALIETSDRPIQRSVGNIPASAQSAAGRTATIRSGWYCSPGSQDDAVQLNLAIAHNDMLAAAGHIKQNGAFNLEVGTNVTVILHGASSLVFVRVVSGYHEGERCWLPASIVR